MSFVTYSTPQGSAVGRVSGGMVASVGDVSLVEALAGAAEPAGSMQALESVRVLPPLALGAKVLCVALNYVDHAKEARQPIPETPIVFLKSREALIAGGAPIRLPKAVTQIDYEAELALVIGKPAFEIEAADAWEHIAGVTTFNDVSARDLFRVRAGDAHHLDWFSGKCLDRSTPVGPEVLPLAAIREDLQSGTTRIRCLVNGEVRQDAPVSDMIFDIPTLVAFIASRITLNPGDIIATGTPPGVGAGTNRYLKSGDIVRVEVTGLPPMENMVA